MKATPRTLDEAIQDVLEAAPEQRHAVMKDYLSQKFTAALMRCHRVPGSEQIVQALFEACVTKGEVRNADTNSGNPKQNVAR